MRTEKEIRDYLIKIPIMNLLLGVAGISTSGPDIVKRTLLWVLEEEENKK